MRALIEFLLWKYHNYWWILFHYNWWRPQATVADTSIHFPSSISAAEACNSYKGVIGVLMCWWPASIVPFLHGHSNTFAWVFTELVGVFLSALCNFQSGHWYRCIDATVIWNTHDVNLTYLFYYYHNHWWFRRVTLNYVNTCAITFLLFISIFISIYLNKQLLERLNK